MANIVKPNYFDLNEDLKYKGLSICVVDIQNIYCRPTFISGNFISRFHGDKLDHDD